MLYLANSFLFSQEIESAPNLNQNAFLREEAFDNKFSVKDTIELFLEDTSFYIMIDYDQLINEFRNQKDVYKYFSSSLGLQFQFRDSLQDGFYCLYNLTREKAKKIKNKEEFVLASGEFKNKMRKGAFTFYYIPDNPKWTKAEKTIYFKDDVVHGVVIEKENDRIAYLGEYKMGVMHGFFYYYNNGVPVIVLYEDGVVIKSSEFW